MESSIRDKIVQLTKNPMMIEFTGQRIVERLTEKDLIKLEKIMKKHKVLNITSFLRILRSILQPSQQQDFYMTYGLFRLFQETCMIAKHSEITFKDISSMVTDKMPSFNQDMMFSQKMYPTSFQVPDSIKKKIFAPQVIGKVLEERERLQEQPYLFDKYIHLNRRVGQSYYSPKNNMFITIDNPSNEIWLLDGQFQLKKTVKTELQFSKRDSIIHYIAWSEQQQRLAALLGNFSLSLWAMEDNFRFEVNVPLPMNLYTNPYVRIGYMETSKIWYALDSRPSIYILSHANYQPEYVFSHFKMINEKQQKVMIVELKYRKLLCIAFEKNIFLVSLEKKQLVTQLRNFSTTITSIAFSQTYQALFVSNFQYKFYSYQLTEHLDLTQKGKFEGHKNHVSILGVLEDRPVVYSIDEKSIIKLWDMRDFMCYQTFTILKNASFKDIIALPESVCFIGSKHFCYQWQRFTSFKQAEKVICINQLQKNLMIVTSKQLRVYSHSNGVLLKVLKGVFGNLPIVKAQLIECRKIILLINEEGLLKIYGTKDFLPINSFQISPKPQYIYYDRDTELLSVSCMGEVKICLMNDMINLPSKRTIFNNEEIIKFCQISAVHDLIMIQYEDNPYIFFYSYERSKLLGHLKIQDLVSAKMLPNRNVIFFLCKDKLLIMTYRKNMNALAFMLKGMQTLWQEQQVKNHNISFHFKPFDKIVSAGLEIYDSQIVVVSNDACFHCHIKYKVNLLESFQVKINKQYYNPYRIANQNHIEAFDPKRASILIDEKKDIFSQKNYHKYKGNKNFVLLKKINLFYGVADQHEVDFYDLNGVCMGVFNFKQTLPHFWQLHNYSEQQFKQLEFVLEFIERQKHKQDELFELTSSSILPKGQIITMNMLRTRQLQPKAYRSTSLREKKMVLEKERDERQKQQNYQQVRRLDQLTKLKNLNTYSNQKYVSQSLAFLNVNRNKLLLTKGIQQLQLPQIRALEHKLNAAVNKLNAAVNKDEKKSIISKQSAGQDFMTPMRRVQEQIANMMTQSTADLKLIPQTERKQSYKEQLKRLDLNLRKSKFKRSSRSGSLPVLKYG